MSGKIVPGRIVPLNTNSKYPLFNDATENVSMPYHQLL